jgi:hypothetical protein
MNMAKKRSVLLLGCVLPFFLFASILASTALADPKCNGGLCIGIVPDTGAHDCGAFMHENLYNAANQRASVKVLVTIEQNGAKATRLDNYELGPNTRQFIGCTGSLGPTIAQHISYTVQAIKWH